jgi:hypothetical protein
MVRPAFHGRASLSVTSGVHYLWHRVVSVLGKRSSRSASGRVVHDPRGCQASSDRALVLRPRTSAPLARGRLASRGAVARPLGRSTPRGDSHPSARRIPSQSRPHPSPAGLIAEPIVVPAASEPRSLHARHHGQIGRLPPPRVCGILIDETRIYDGPSHGSRVGWPATGRAPGKERLLTPGAGPLN